MYLSLRIVFARCPRRAMELGSHKMLCCSILCTLQRRIRLEVMNYHQTRVASHDTCKDQRVPSMFHGKRVQPEGLGDVFMLTNLSDAAVKSSKNLRRVQMIMAGDFSRS